MRFEARGPHDLRPFLGFIGDKPAKVDRRHRHWIASEIGEPCPDLGIGEARIDLLVELVDDFDGRVLGCADAIRCADLVAWHELAHGLSFGRASERTEVVTANARSLPAFMFSIDDAIGLKKTCTCPASRSVMAGGSPRYGT